MFYHHLALFQPPPAKPDAHVSAQKPARSPPYRSGWKPGGLRRAQFCHSGMSHRLNLELKIGAFVGEESAFVGGKVSFLGEKRCNRR